LFQVFLKAEVDSKRRFFTDKNLKLRIARTFHTKWKKTHSLPNYQWFFTAKRENELLSSSSIFCKDQYLPTSPPIITCLNMLLRCDPPFRKLATTTSYKKHHSILKMLSSASFSHGLLLIMKFGKWHTSKHIPQVCHCSTSLSCRFSLLCEHLGP